MTEKLVTNTERETEGVIPSGINTLLKRQANAGIGNEPLLTKSEQKQLQTYYTEAGTISPQINDLLKKQAVAGIGGNPELTDSEREEIRNFHASRGGR